MAPNKKQTADELLAQKGITIKELDNLLRGHEPTVKVIRLFKGKHYKFGVVSDTHLVSKADAVSELHNMYDRFAKEGITEVVHAGDIADGMGIYSGQENELRAFGFEDHLAYVAKKYPQRKGITTYFIGGNHDEGYKKRAGIDFGKHLASKRSDLVYLGLYDGTVVLNGVRIRLHHGAKSVPYAISYHMQKYVEKIAPGNKPQIYILGW